MKLIMSILYLLSLSLLSVHSVCDNYFQQSTISSTKRPFDICYHSEIDTSLIQSSYRYTCNESDYGENYTITHTDTGKSYTAFVETYDVIDCQGEPTSITLIDQPFSLYCGNKCEILRTREYPIKNITECTYNSSIYQEDIQVIAICDDDGIKSDAVFCSKSSNNQDSYFWVNTYYNSECENKKLFEATYQFHGCQGDGNTYLEIVQCDFNSNGFNEVKPFDDSLFVGGFVLLLIAILFIIFILIWYCCWYKKGFNGSINNKPSHVRSASHSTKRDSMGATTTGEMR